MGTPMIVSNADGNRSCMYTGYSHGERRKLQ